MKIRSDQLLLVAGAAAVLWLLWRSGNGHLQLKAPEFTENAPSSYSGADYLRSATHPRLVGPGVAALMQRGNLPLGMPGDPVFAWLYDPPGEANL